MTSENIERETRIAKSQKEQSGSQNQNPWQMRNSGKTYTVIGMIQELKLIRTKKGDEMAFATLQDFNGTIDLTFFPKTWGTIRQQVHTDAVYAFKGKLDASNEEPSVLVDSLEDISSLQINSIHEVHIQLDENLKDEFEIQELKNFLFGTSGNCLVYFHIETAEGLFTIKANSQLTSPCNKEFLDALADIPFVKEVWTV